MRVLWFIIFSFCFTVNSMADTSFTPKVEDYYGVWVLDEEANKGNEYCEKRFKERNFIQIIEKDIYYRSSFYKDSIYPDILKRGKPTIIEKPTYVFDRDCDEKEWRDCSKMIAVYDEITLKHGIYGGQIGFSSDYKTLVFDQISSHCFLKRKPVNESVGEK